MFKKFSFYSLFFHLLFIFFYCSIGFYLFTPIYLSDSLIVSFAIHPFDICNQFPTFWFYFKLIFLFLYFTSSLTYSHISFKYLSKFFISNKKSPGIISHNIDNLQLLIGENLNSEKIYLPERSLYQNILITGTIGSGKTSSAIYPFSEQLIKYKCNSFNKLGILFLDVKGNLVNQIYNYAKRYNRLSDLIIIGLDSNQTYNPLHKPNLNPSVLANRLKTILTLFSPNNSESYWLDKVEQILTESIKICRLYNNGYVNFTELHNLINNKDYFYSKISYLRLDFQKNKFNNADIYNLYSSINFFENEFFSLDDRTISILKSEVTRITSTFISDYNVSKTFSPNINEITFSGFEDLINSGKLVVLSMNIAEYKNLSKIIATYLKLDFQTEVLQRLKTNNVSRPVAFICDEFHEYVTSTDSDFFAQSRESKCINIVATQSYSSLLCSLHNNDSVNVILQNLSNKLWFRSDDLFTIESAQKQIGREEKEKISTTISENSKETFYNHLLNQFNSIGSNISESYNSYTQLDFIYDVNAFSRNLETFSCISFLSDGDKILSPCKLKMFPYFKNN